MKHWFMLAVVGKDKPGIVAKLTEALFDLGCNLGEASMERLGDTFAIMLMVNYDGKQPDMENALAPVAETYALRVHIDPIEHQLHHDMVPNVVVRVFGADQAGIVAKVTRIMADQLINITSLETEVAGTEHAPLYVMIIEAYAETSVEALQKKMQSLNESGFDVRVSEVDVMLG